MTGALYERHVPARLLRFYTNVASYEINNSRSFTSFWDLLICFDARNCQNVYFCLSLSIKSFSLYYCISCTVFDLITALFVRSRRRCWKPRPKAAVFNTSQGTWRMLMHWKTMFNHYYCIKVKNICYLLFLALFCFAILLMSRESNFHGLCSFKGRALHISWRQQLCGPGTGILKVA